MVIKNKDNYLSPRTINFSWLLPVLNNLTTPPANPNDGARYRVIAVATGAWTGKENNIAIWDDETQKWIFQILTEAQTWYDFTSQNWHYMSNAGIITTFDKIPLAESDVTGLVTDLANKAPLVHKSNHVVVGSDPFVAGDNLDATSKCGVKTNSGTLIGNRRTHNFINGSNITITAADNAGGESVDITINSAGSGAVFLDNLFKIENSIDATKIIAFDASVVPTVTTRTIKPPTANGTIVTLENAETFSATKTSSVNGDVLIPAVDGQGNIGKTGQRFALVRAVTITSGDIVLSDRKTGKELYVIHEDKRGIYFSDHKTGKTRMFLDMKNGNLKITGKLIQNAKIMKKFKKPKSPALKQNLRGHKTCH